MIIRPKAKRRIALLSVVVSLVALAGGLALHFANKRGASRLDAERVAALADYRADNFAVALPHLRHYLEKTKDGDQVNSGPYLDAMFAYGKCRMSVRAARNGHLIEAKSILQNYLALRPDDLDAQHTLLSIYPQIDYQQEQLSLAEAVLAKHPDDEKALVAKVQALMNQPRPALPEARKACDRLNAKWPTDLQGQLLGMEIRLRMRVPPEDLIDRAESLHKEHPNDARFELLLGATYLGVSRVAPRSAGTEGIAAGNAGSNAGGNAASNIPVASGIAGAPGNAAATTSPAAPPAGEAARVERRTQGLHWLQAAFERTPPDADFVRIFVAICDLNDLYPQALDLLRKDAPVLHDRQLNSVLVQRLWENHYDQEVLDRTADLDPKRPSTDAGSLALRASALYELASAASASTASASTASASTVPSAPNAVAFPGAPGPGQAHRPQSAEAAAIVQALAGRKEDPPAQAWATLLRAQYAPAGGAAKTGKVGGEARELANQCMAALSEDSDNAVAYLLSGEAYAGLGEKETAAARWDEAAWHAPEWAMPHARVAQLRLTQGRADEAMTRAQAALMRSPQTRAVRAIYVLAWHATLKDSPRDWTKDGAWDRLLKEARAIQDQWPNELETLPLYVTLLAESGQRDAAVAAVKTALASTPPPPTETLLALDEVSGSHALGLGDALVERARSADGNSVSLAMRRALDLLRAGDAAAGLAVLSDARKAAAGENDSAWRVAVANYLERSNDPSALKTWIDLGDKSPGDLLVQSAVLQSIARYEDRAFWKRSIDRLKALTGDEGQLWRLERCRWLLAGIADGSSAAPVKDRSEAITTLTELTREFPGEAEPHRLLAAAFEGDNKPDRAAEELGIAVSLRPGDVETALEGVRLLRAAGKGSEALAALDRAARRPGPSPVARRMLASAYEQQGNPEKAIELLTAGASAPPATAPATSPADGSANAAEVADTDDAARDGMLARLYARLGRFDKAEALFTKLLDNPAAPPQDLADGAELFASQGKTEQASEFLTRLAGLKLPTGAIQVIMGRFHERFGPADEALRSFTEATTVAPKSAAAWRELAGYHLRHGRLSEAAAAADQGAKAVPGDAALTAFARNVALLKVYKRPTTLSSLIDALANDPADPAATELLKALADAQEHNDPPAQRVARLKEVAGRHPEFFPAQEQLILAYLEMRQFQNAIDVATAAVQAAPYDPAPARLATGVYLTAGQTSRALDAANVWRQRSGADTLPADLAIADALVSLDRPGEAVDRLAPYLPKAGAAPATPGAHDAPNLTVCRVYARALIAAGRSADAAGLLQPLLAADGDAGADARRLWMLLASAHKTADSASAWLEQVAPRLPDNAPDERFALAEAWRAVGSQFSSVPALQKARDLLAPMSHRPGADTPVWALTAEVAQELGDYDTAEQGWRRLLQDATAKNQAVRPEVRNNLAYVLMIRGDNGSLPEAQQLAEQAVAAAPDSSIFYDTLARIYSRAGKRDQAVKSFRTALDKDANNVEAMIGLADELSHGGGKDDASAARSLVVRINRLVEKSPSLSGPLQEQLKNVRSRASLDAGEGR